MKFARLAFAAFYLAARSTAWTATTSSRAVWTGRSSLLVRRHIAAVQLHSTASPTAVETKVDGEEKTESFRLKFLDGGSAISPWHDIPLKNADGSYNMVRAVVLI